MKDLIESTPETDEFTFSIVGSFQIHSLLDDGGKIVNYKKLNNSKLFINVTYRSFIIFM